MKSMQRTADYTNRIRNKMRTS